MPTFTPPTIPAPRTLPGDPSPFNRMARYFDRGRLGLWVLKEDGVYSAVASPDTTRLQAAEKVYAGAHIHTITEEEAAELIAAGFGDGVS